MKTISLTGLLLALGSAILWGTAGTAQSFVSDGLTPYWVGALRLCCACAFFFPLLSLKAKTPRKNTSQATQQTYWLYICLAGLSMALYNLGFFSGVKATGIAIGSATTIGSAPIWAGFLDALVNRKKPSLLWWSGTLCATAGGVWMVISQANSWHINTMGLCFCLGAGLCYAIYTMLSKKLVSLTTPLKATSHTFAVAALIAIPAAILISGPIHFTASDLIVVLYLGLATTGVAYLLYTNALIRISATTGVAMTLFEPVTAFFLAILVAKEPVSWVAFIGLCGILVGLKLVLSAEAKAR